MRMTATVRGSRGQFLIGKMVRERLGGSLILQNLVWNYAGLIWLNMLSVISVSLYVRILGAHQWGLIAACVSLQIVFNVLDMGFSQIAPKWFVSNSEGGHRPDQFFFLFRKIYFFLAVVGFVFLQVSARPLATTWFNVSQADQPVFEMAIRLIALQFVFQFLNSLNNSVWSGQQKQRLMNLRTCAFMTIRHVVALSLLFFLYRDVRVYCAVFMVVSGLEWITNYRRVRVQFTQPDRMTDGTLVRQVVREMSVLIAGVLIGTAVAQMDRVTLSRALPVQQFGAYTLALTLALALLQLQMPVTRSFFPRIVRDIQATCTVAPRTWHGLYGFTVLFVGVPALILAVVAHPLMLLWIGNATIAGTGAPALRILCAGVFLNSIYNCLYQYLLASGRSSLILRINVISLLGVGTLIMCWKQPLTPNFGGAIWITVGLLQVCCGAVWYYIHVRTVRSEKERSC